MKVDKKMETATLKELILVFENPERRARTHWLRMWLCFVCAVVLMFIGSMLKDWAAPLYVASGCAIGLSVLFQLSCKQVPVIVKHLSFDCDRAKAILAERSKSGKADGAPES
jgi:hypothetical protein